MPADNYGRAYIGLLESPLTGNAKLCYAVMWSFGQESWAAVPSIARRMSAAENTVRKAQSELQAAGWIKLLEDSKGGSSKTWEMVPPTLQDVKGYPSPDEGSTLQDVKGNKEGKQVLNKEKTNTAPKGAVSKHPDQDEFWTLAQKAWVVKFPESAALGWPRMTGFPKALYAALDRLGAKELARRWSNMVMDPFSRPDLHALVHNPDKWMDLRTGKAPTARPFNSPPPSGDRRPTGGSIGDEQ